MKKLRIGYQPLSPDLSQPGDRRRVAFWAKNRGHTIITDLDEQVDVILLSERADFGAFPLKARGVPIIFDLVDGYLATENRLMDWVRGTSKVFAGQLTGFPSPFTTFVKNLCLSSSAVICSSAEQRELILPYSDNVHVILDSHDEFAISPFRTGKSNSRRQILWEGMPATLGGLSQIQAPFSEIHKQTDFRINFVTDTKYFRLLGKYLYAPTSSLLKTKLGQLYANSTITPWTLENLISTSAKSDLAIIPIVLTSPIQFLKPENRLLIMWRLGLPCLTSPSPAYRRVTAMANSDTICSSGEEWISKAMRLLNNESEAEAIVSRGQSYIREFHNTDLLLEKWDRTFESVVSI